MNDEHEILSLQHDCIISDVGGDLAIPEATRVAIEEVWHSENQKRGKHLYNGRIFTVISIQPEHIAGRFIDYKTYLASRHKPELFAASPINSLAISAMVTANGQVLIGKRSQVVTNFPGSYEFVPSGGIDDSCARNGRIDARHQVITEFLEETGIAESFIRDIKFLSLHHDQPNRLYDLCAHVELTQAVAPTLHTTDEYVELFWLDFDKADAFLKENAKDVLATTRHLWQGFRKG